MQLRATLASTWTRRILAIVRLVNGFLGLFLPHLLVKRLDVDPAANRAAFYPFRMFGIRTIVLGADLLTMADDELRRAERTAIVIHSVDTIAAAVGGLRGDVPPKAARLTTAISAVNTCLAVVTWWGRPRRTVKTRSQDTIDA
jgi:hypothetical protein